MSEGRIVFETPAAGADRRMIGSHMGGGDHGQHVLVDAEAEAEAEAA
jgi:simple sugar transport system ATP-binding protein